MGEAVGERRKEDIQEKLQGGGIFWIEIDSASLTVLH